MSHVAETASYLNKDIESFPAPPLDLDKNEHAIRRISTLPVMMGGFPKMSGARVTDLV